MIRDSKNLNNLTSFIQFVAFFNTLKYNNIKTLNNISNEREMKWKDIRAFLITLLNFTHQSS
jgi:hypothetical protein